MLWASCATTARRLSALKRAQCVKQPSRGPLLQLLLWRRHWTACASLAPTILWPSRTSLPVWLCWTPLWAVSQRPIRTNRCSRPWRASVLRLPPRNVWQLPPIALPSWTVRLENCLKLSSPWPRPVHRWTSQRTIPSPTLAGSPTVEMSAQMQTVEP